MNGWCELLIREPQWEKKKALIVAKTYPSPAKQGMEVSCTGAVTEDHKWLRLFPIPFRLLSEGSRFQKYQWIEADLQRASDPRPESFRVNVDSICISEESLSSRNNWQSRKDFLAPLDAHCLCCLQQEQRASGSPTLGWFKPAEITKFSLVPDSPNWSPSELAKLTQTDMFEESPHNVLEKIPFKFYYHFSCDHIECPGHRLSCVDWELAESYRKWKRLYGSDWKSKFIERYENYVIKQCDTYFFVGTVRIHPNSWIIVGLFYPKLERKVNNSAVEQLLLL